MDDQSGEELFFVARVGHLGVRRSERREHMRIASAQTGLAQAAGELLGLAVMKGLHLSAIHLERRHIGFDPGEIVQDAAARKAGEDVVHAKEKTTLRKIGQQAYEVVATPLNFDMLE